MSDMRVAAQILPLEMGEADLVVPSVRYAVEVKPGGVVKHARSRYAHGLMAYTRRALKQSGCQFYDTSQGEDDLFIRCMYYSGLEVAGVALEGHLVLGLHTKNIWNKGTLLGLGFGFILD